ncbi:MAG: RES domain-containing protein [Bacteroidota bacterium]|nr:RES domain-containing protein [Bacteroidota bacterium]
MYLYRVVRHKYLYDLSGNGSKLFGGRWNSPGIPALYTSASKSLAVLESLTNTPPAILQNDFSILILEITGKILADEFQEKDLPKNWKVYPAPVNLAKMGDKWLLARRRLLLKVPSVVIPSEYNFIINPLHKDRKRVKIIAAERLELDTRVADNMK